MNGLSLSHFTTILTLEDPNPLTCARYIPSLHTRPFLSYAAFLSWFCFRVMIYDAWFVFIVVVCYKSSVWSLFIVVSSRCNVWLQFEM